MIHLIHGSNSLASFRALEQILGSYDDLSVTRLSGQSLSLNDFKEAVETPSFSGKRLVIVEDLSQNRSSATVKELAQYLKNLPESCELVIYERKLLTPDSPLLALSAKVQGFAASGGTNIFNWGDTVGKRDRAKAIAGWQELLHGGEDEEYLFLMLVRQIRLLILAKKGYPPKGPDFVKDKISAQARFWTEGELKAVYQKLLQIDRNHKAGLASLDVGMTEVLSGIGKS